MRGRSDDGRHDRSAFHLPWRNSESDAHGNSVSSLSPGDREPTGEMDFGLA